MLRKAMLMLVLSMTVWLAGCSGASGEVKASLNEEFTLPVERTASIRSEDLRIRFVEVTGDSRCPLGVICIWQGEVSCAVEVTAGGVSEQMVWKQPGLAGDTGLVSHRGYRFSFTVEPYPERDRQITGDAYRMKMTVSKG